VHLPVQSGSNRIFKIDAARSHIENYLERIDKIKASPREISPVPPILSSDFPGETEEDFQATLDLAEYCQFNSATFSNIRPRPGTPAFRNAGYGFPGGENRAFSAAR
jgi:tRNA-2-methylthio-N6-dimethylallyladenosine synthase